MPPTERKREFDVHEQQVNCLLLCILHKEAVKVEIATMGETHGKGIAKRQGLPIQMSEIRRVVTAVLQTANKLAEIKLLLVLDPLRVSGLDTVPDLVVTASPSLVVVQFVHWAASIASLFLSRNVSPTNFSSSHTSECH